MATRPPPVFAEEFPPAAGHLEGVEAALSQLCGPVGDQDAVGGAGDRVLGDSHPGGEEAGYEIAAIAPRGDDHAAAGEPAQGRDVGIEAPNRLFRVQNRQQVLGGGVRLEGQEAQRRFEVPRPDRAEHGARREVQRQEIPLPADGEPAAVARGEADGGLLDPPAVEEDEGGRERRVAAQGHLGRRREPAQFPAPAVREQEGRFGQVVFGRDRLQVGVAGPALEDADPRGVAREDPGGEGVDVVEGDEHRFLRKADPHP